MDGISSRITLLILLSLIVFGLNVPHAMGMNGPPPVLNPKVYHAPAGRWAITIDPSNRYGRGEAVYRVEEDGKVVWTATLPFTLWDAGITDSGVVGGYAYTRGPSAVAEPGDFLVVILDREGKFRLQESVKREASLFIHASPNPGASGLIVDEPNDRMVVRVADADENRRHESWWCYRLSTATPLEKLTPATLMKNREPARFVLDAKPISDTPLTLVHWWRYDDRERNGTVGARFTVVDLHARPVWSLELPKDYTIPGNEKAEDMLRDVIGERGGILRWDRPGEFDLYFASAAKRVTFSVKQAHPGNWKVTEIARSPYTLVSSAAPKPPIAAARPLNYEGQLVLKGSRSSVETEVRAVNDFVFDGQGRIAFVRQERPSEQAEFILVDGAGKLLRKVPLKVATKPDSRWTGYCWVGGSRFVITMSEPGQEAKSRAWWIETETAKLHAIDGFDCPVVSRLIGFADGGFVALATTYSKYTLETSVIGFDARGRRSWTLRDDFNNRGPDRLFSVEDIAGITQDEIAILENIPHMIKCFDRHGRFQRAIDIKAAWGREPSYLSGIAADFERGFLIKDFHGTPPFVRMKRDGATRSGITPKYTDGRAVDPADGIQVSPDGRLWTCDGSALIRLSDEGTVDLVLGQPPASKVLGRIAGITVDHKGQIYAVDSRTGSIHVFDSAGSSTHVCETRPGDFDESVLLPAISVSDRAEVYLGLGNRFEGGNDERKFAHFSADGARLEDLMFPASRCYVQPVTQNIVALRYDDVQLTDSSGKLIREIKRRPDGNWLDNLREVSLAEDGSMAVVTAPGAPPAVSIYKADGEPVRVVPLPESAGAFPRIDYDGRRLVVSGDDGLSLVDLSGTTWQKITPPQMLDPRERYWQPFFVDNGNRLLLFDGDTSTLHRYSLP